MLGLTKVILNFMFSVDAFKSESNHCLLFGQMLSEILMANVGLFIGEVRGIIEDECGFKILSALEKKSALEAIRIPYAKLRGIVAKFVSRTSVESGVEAFMEQLRDRYPTVSAA